MPRVYASSCARINRVAGVTAPALADRAAAAELREVLHAAGFTGAGVQAALGAGGDALAQAMDTPLYERRLAGNEPLGTLIELLMLERTEASEPARRAFAPFPLERLDQLGIAAPDREGVRPLVRLAPHEDLLIASDRRVGAAGADHVVGVHPPSLTLAHLTVRAPAETALDVGTGCGIQAILVSRHSERVVATDVNERALEFAAFNARLNGVENVEFRAGSFFDPVDRMRFGLVTCNPPYVISPESAYMFRDSGLDGDTVSRHVAERAPDHLAEGAFAHMLVSWVVAPEDEWSRAPRSWIEGSGCDAWLLHHQTVDPLTHASAWLRHEVGGNVEAYGEALDRWLAYFARLGIEQIAVGAIILRRRDGANWVLATVLPSDRLGTASDHILRVFVAQDFLATLQDDRALLGERLVRAESSLLEQRAVFGDGGWGVAEISLTLQDGLGFRATLDPTTAGMLAALDGKRTLGDAADDLASLQGIGRDEVERTLIPVARQMLAVGFLVRV